MSERFSAKFDSALGSGIEGLVRSIARRPGRIAVYILLATVVIGGALFSLIEQDADYFDGIWWTVVTLTTVGYGDYSPESFLGRWLAALVMFGGIAAVAILTGLLAGEIAKRRISSHQDTAELDDDIDMIIETVSTQLNDLKARVSHPRVVAALRDCHAELNGHSEGGRNT